MCSCLRFLRRLRALLLFLLLLMHLHLHLRIACTGGAMLYLLLLQLKLLVMQQRFLQGGCLSSSLACLLCKCSCCCCCFISLKIRSDNKEQAGAPCAENTKAPSAERGATKK